MGSRYGVEHKCREGSEMSLEKVKKVKLPISFESDPRTRFKVLSKRNKVDRSGVEEDI